MNINEIADEDENKDKDKTKITTSTSLSSSSGKLDDLADCMLQAAAWARWKGNERVMKRDGWEALVWGRIG